MTVLHKVYGSAMQAVPLVISDDTVFVHTDIEKTDTNEAGEVANGLYTYTETQYTKDEYILLMAEKNNELEKQLNDTQLALCELYEMVAQ